MEEAAAERKRAREERRLKMEEEMRQADEELERRKKEREARREVSDLLIWTGLILLARWLRTVPRWSSVFGKSAEL